MIQAKDFQNEVMALDALVDDFALEMKAKLRSKYEMDGYFGWDSRGTIDEIKNNLSDHLYRRDGRKTDWVDIANFSAFLWNLKDESDPHQATNEE